MKTNKVTPLDIKKMVAKAMGATASEFESNKRVGLIIKHKHISMFLCEKNISISQQKLAQEFKLRRHTNIISTRKKIEAFLSFAERGLESYIDYKLIIDSVQKEIDILKRNQYNDIYFVEMFVLGKSIN